MTSDEEKIAALKAIRDSVRASQSESPEDDLKTLLESKRDAYKHQVSYDNVDDYDNFLSGERFTSAENMVGTDVFDEDDLEIDDHFLDDETDEDFDQEDDDEDGEADDDDFVPPPASTGGNENPWRAVYTEYDEDLPILDIQFNGKNLENGEFNDEDLENANFSAANLSGVNFSGSNLRGADFSGANLTETNLSGADLTGAIFAGSQLIGTNFTGAVMNHVVLTDAYFDQAILTDIIIDDITIEELQDLIEYLAQYYPHKLDLSKLNLTMLDLTRIDLTKVSLKGVDFTGCDLTGVNIMELDLSECIISPEQIAQALGRIPSPEELKKILAPKKAKGKAGGKAIDFSDLFVGDARNYGVYNVAGFEGMNVEKLVDVSRRVFKKREKPPVKDTEALEKIREQNTANKEELRNVIEERKRRVLANRSRRSEVGISKASNQR